MSFFCDFSPYFFGFIGGVYREPFKSIPGDLSNTEIVSVSGRLCGLVSPVGSVAQWTAIGGQSTAECLANMVLQPGRLFGSEVHANGSLARARVDDVAGELKLYWNGVNVSNVALPGSVWRTSSDFESCWVRLQYDSGTLVLRARVWSEDEPEPATWLVSYTTPTALVVAGALSFGASGVSTAQCFAWVSWGGVNTCPTPRRASNRDYFSEWMSIAHTQGGPTDRRVMIADVFAPGHQFTPGPNVMQRRPSVMRAATQPFFTNVFPYNGAPYPAILRSFLDASRKLPDTIVGAQTISWGALEIDNENGVNDNWLRAHNLRAAVIVRYGDPSWPIFDLATIFTGEITDVSEANGIIRLTVRDSMSRFDRALPVSLLPENGGKPIPRALGACYNVEPPLVEPVTLTYQIAPGAIEAIDAVRDSGVALTTIATAIHRYFAATDTLRTAAPHGLSAGYVLQFTNANLPPFTTGVDYFVRSAGLTSTDFTLSASLGGAAVDVTGVPQAVKGTFYATDEIELDGAHGLVVGDPVQASGAGTPTELSAGSDRYIVEVNGNKVKVSATLGGAPINIVAIDLRTVSAWDTALDRITFSAVHGRAVNDPVVFEGAPGAPVVAGTVYYVKTVVSTTVITISTTPGGATLNLTGAAGATTMARSSEFTLFKPAVVSVTRAAFTTDLANGTFRLNVNPAGQITCDVRGEKFGGAYAGTIRHAVRCVLGDNPGVDFAFRFATPGFFSKSIGLWIDDAVNTTEILDAIAESANATWSANRVGAFTMRSIGANDGDVIDLDNDRVGTIEIASKGLPERNPPATTFFYRKNWTVQSGSDLAGAVSAADRQRFAAEFWEESALFSFVPQSDNATQGEVRDLIRKTSLGTNLTDGVDAYFFPSKQQLIVRVTMLFTALDRFSLGESIETLCTRTALASTAATIIGVDESLSKGTVTLTLQIPVAGFFPPI